MPVLCRFDELRIKTEDQLLRLVNNTLASGLHDAQRALKCAEAWEDHWFRAHQAYSEALRLIPLMGEVPARERRRLEAGREQLREMLAALSVLGSTPTGDAVPALARALWKVRGCPEGSSEEDWFQAEEALKSHAFCMGN